MDKHAERGLQLPIAKRIISLKEASKTKNDDAPESRGGSLPKYCFELSPECSIKAVDFDAVQRALAGIRKISLPCSVDALLLSDDVVYAVEFKTGAVDMVNVYRKIYDTVLTLVECAHRSPSYARQRIVYVLVLSRLSKKIRQLGHYMLGMRDPWRKLPLEDYYRKLKLLGGCLVRDVEIMPPEFFQRYLKANKVR